MIYTEINLQPKT